MTKIIRKIVNALDIKMTDDDKLFAMEDVVVMNMYDKRGKNFLFGVGLILLVYSFVNNIPVSELLMIKTWENLVLSLPCLFKGFYFYRAGSIYVMFSLIGIYYVFLGTLFPFAYYKIYIFDEHSLKILSKNYYIKKIEDKVVTLKSKNRIFYKNINRDMFINYDDIDED